MLQFATMTAENTDLGKTCIYIDGPNFRNSLLHCIVGSEVENSDAILSLDPDILVQNNTATDFRGLFEEALLPRVATDITRRYYTSRVEPWNAHNLLEKDLALARYFERIGYEVLRRGVIRRLSSGKYLEKGVDTKIAADIARDVERGTFDTIAIVSHDADFIPVVEDILVSDVRVMQIKIGNRQSSSFPVDRENLIQISAGSIRQRIPIEIIQLASRQYRMALRRFSR